MPLDHEPATTALYITGASEEERAEALKACMKHAANDAGDVWLKRTPFAETISGAVNSMESSRPGSVTNVQEQGLEEPLYQLRIYHDKTGGNVGLHALIEELRNDDDHVQDVVTMTADGLVDRSAGLDRVEALVTGCDVNVHFVEQQIVLQAGMPVEGARKRVVTTLSDSLHPRADEGEDTYQHTGGRPPLGFEASDGRLVPADDYEKVCTVLQQVSDSRTSKRGAAKELGCVRGTVLNALERPEMYNLS